MYDFWRWEYDYGHNLDPRAAIRIPGMSYQPPLIGTAKLLNFTSTSWPAAGGILLFAAGGLLALALLLAWRSEPRPGGRPVSTGRLPRGGLAGCCALALCAALAAGCGRAGPGPIDWGVDACHHCKMALIQKGFAAQRLNAKGKVFRFDSIECLLADLAERPGVPEERYYVSDLSRPEADLLPAEDAAYLRGSRISSPMGGSLAGFASSDSARHYREQAGGNLLTWGELLAR
jgi:copper chaperone NosL